MRLNWPPRAYLWSGLAGFLIWMWVRRKSPIISGTASIGGGFPITQLINRAFGRWFRRQPERAGRGDRLTRRKRTSDAIEGEHGGRRSMW
jgi:hypothetical protein